MPDLIDIVLGSDFVEGDPEMIDEIDGLNWRHLGDNDSEVVDDHKRHRCFNKQLRLHSHTCFQTVRHWPVKQARQLIRPYHPRSVAQRG